MKKIILVFMTCFILVGCSSNKPSYMSQERLKIQGDVDSLEYHMFDEDGQEIDMDIYFEGYNISFPSEMEILENGLFIEYEDLDGYYSGTSTYIYDKKGYLLHETYENNYDNSYNVYDYISDQKDDMAVVEDNLVEGECEVEGTDGDDEFDVEYIYDEDGRLLETTDFNSEGDQDLKLKFYYDDEDNIKKYKFYSGTSLSYTVKFEYEDGLMVYYEYEEDGITTTYEFDYEFDEEGNWIEAELTVDDDYEYTIEREIDYN